MNRIDEAILEGLLESRIYSVSSGRFYTFLYHPRPCNSEVKFGEMWTVVQFKHSRFGLTFYLDKRSSWGTYFEKNRALEKFEVTNFIEYYLQNEMQKNMTE